MSGVERGVSDGSARDFSIDALRSILMLLGIPYHVTFLYKVDSDWSVADSQRAWVFDVLADALHSFRMAAFFLIAGYFSALLLARRPVGVWLQSRLKQIGIPLVAATLTVLPLVMVIEIYAVARPEDLWSALARKLATPGGHWVAHLWFLAVLLELSFGLALSWRWMCKLDLARLDRFFMNSPVTCTAAVILFIGVYQAFTGVPARLLSIVIADDVILMFSITEAFRFLPFFLIGVFLQGMPGTFALFRTVNPWVIACAILATAGYVVFSDVDTIYGRVVTRALTGACGVLMTSVLLAAARKLFDKKRAIVSFLVDSAIVIYVFHFPIIFLISLISNKFDLSIYFEFAFVVLLVYLFSFVVWILISRFEPLRFAFTGRARRLRDPADAKG